MASEKQARQVRIGDRVRRDKRGIYRKVAQIVHHRGDTVDLIVRNADETLTTWPVKGDTVIMVSDR